ncbi:tape measure protein [Ligilactobacillus acidipiscis]|uniref:tape measure protein n=1 Tax=Ligilactobacillus acidipiscis TaxID=89059 RepID=UPI0023F819CF|nr:tape measure protein [Ligilactobacillus acidipiscis]WEV56127.1 tape measure protein [Ligilactobacillus acidipiscis]
MAGDGRIQIDFDMDLNGLKSDAEKAKSILKSTGDNAGDNLNKNFKSNADKVATDSKKASEQVKKDFSGTVHGNVKVNANTKEADQAKAELKRFPKETITKLNVDAKKHGIDNFKSLLRNLPKEKRTELLTKASQGQAINYEKLLREIPAKKVTELKLNNRASSGLKSVQREAKETGSRFSRLKDIITGSVIGAGIQQAGTAAFGAIKRSIQGVVTTGMQYNKTQQVMQATWNTLTGSAAKGDAFVKSINNMSTAFGQSSDLVNELDQQFYHVLNNRGSTEQLTKSVLTMSDTLGMSASNTERLGQNFTHMMSSGRMQLGDFNMISDQLPMFGERLLDYERKEQHNNSLTMGDLRNQMSAGKISAQDAENVMNGLGSKYKDATENMMSTAYGAERSIKSNFQKLSGDIVQPFTKMQSPIFLAVSKWVSDKKTENEFKKVGGAAARGFTTVSTALAKALDIKSLPKSANNFMDNLAKGVTNASNVIAAHSKQIVGFFSGLWSAVKIIGNIGVGFFKGIIGAIGAIAKPLGRLSSGKKNLNGISGALGQISKHKKGIQEVGKVLAGAFIGVKLIKGIHSVYNGFKLLAGGLALISDEPIILVIAAVVALAAAVATLVVSIVKHWSTIEKWTSRTWGRVSKWIGNSWDSIKKHVGNGWRTVKNGVLGAWRTLEKRTGSTWSRIKNHIGSSWNNAKKNSANGYNTIRNGVSGAWNYISGHTRSIWSGISGFFGGIWSGIKGTAKAGWSYISGGVRGALGTISGAWHSTWNGIAGFFGGIWAGIKRTAKGGINGVIGWLNGGINGINSVIHTFGGKKHALGRISKLAKGTPGAPRGLAMVNDGDGPEMIVDNRQQAHLLKGRNRLVNFEGGETVVPFEQTRNILTGVSHFAGGTSGWMSSIGKWFRNKWNGLKDIIKHPIRHLTGMIDKAISGATKGSEFVANFTPPAGHQFVRGIEAPFKKLLKSLKSKHDDLDGGGQHGNPGGSGVKRWRHDVELALKQNGLSTSNAMINKVLRQINTESSGNPRAKQAGSDPDGDGSGPALGLMQTKRGTFNQYAFPGHKDIWNGYDDILAGLRYAKARYGSSLSFLGNGHGYADGGHVFLPQVAPIAEDGDEFVINGSKPTADNLIEQAIFDRARKAPNSFGAEIAGMIRGARSSHEALLAPQYESRRTTYNNVGRSERDYSGRIDSLGQKLDALLDKRVIVDGSSFSKAYEPYGSSTRVRRSVLNDRGLAVNANFN